MEENILNKEMEKFFKNQNEINRVANAHNEIDEQNYSWQYYFGFNGTATYSIKYGFEDVVKNYILGNYDEITRIGRSLRMAKNDMENLKFIYNYNPSEHRHLYDYISKENTN